MRKISLALFVLLVFCTARSFAQTAVEFIPQVGYSFPARNDFYGDYGRVAGGLNLGGALNFNVTRSFGFELLYNHQSTSSGIYNYGYDGGAKLVGGDLNQDYIMGGFVFSGTIPYSTVRPFLGLLLGADIITPMGGNNYASNSHFAAGIQLGTNIYISPRVGIQLKAQFLSPVNSAGDAYYYSNYYGGGINPNQSIYSFTLGGGLIIGLGRVLPSQTYHQARRPGPRYRRYYYY
ncbi:MAG TPA: hypothetical protein VGS79_16575 [Puia sp.]|nr:hypothetical protein [Puia sp.]